MYMGYISSDDSTAQSIETLEKTGEKKQEKEQTAEEIAAGEARAAEWSEALGVEPTEQADFSKSMADVIPFPGAAEATIAGATAGIALDAASTIGETPNAEKEEKKKEGEEDEEEEDTNQTEVYNEDGEQQRTINTATEDAAKERGMISDMANYEFITDLVEQKEDSSEPLFIFNVTMQNHGGYKTANYKNLVEILEKVTPARPLIILFDNDDAKIAIFIT